MPGTCLLCICGSTARILAIRLVRDGNEMLFGSKVKKDNLLTRGIRQARPAFITAIIFSFFINILAFVGPLYMLQIYDRVLSSRNVYTLLFLTLIAAFLLIV